MLCDYLQSGGNHVNGRQRDRFRFDLFDQNGRLIQMKEIEGRETDISMDLLLSSFYFLRVESDNKEFKVFKIVKYKLP